MSSRTRLVPSGFIEPCLPSPAERPPSGPNWIHEIKHDGFRLMARRDPVGIRLLTRHGHDWGARYPLIMEAVNRLKVRSCLIDGEAVACDGSGLAVFEHLRRKPTGRHVLLYAFDLLELDGEDLRREPFETRKATLASLLPFGDARSMSGLPETGHGWAARRRSARLMAKYSHGAVTVTDLQSGERVAADYKLNLGRR